MDPRWLSAVAAACVMLPGASASAAVAWVGDLETGDTSQFSYVNHGEYITVGSDEVAQGTFAARIELHNDATWPNGLKRVELQHLPEDERTAEGATTYFAWSIFLPETLPEDPSQTIGYWESYTTWQQVMAFEVEGESITFSTRRPENQVQWQADGVVTAGVWHRIAMRVLWSTDPGVGTVDVWFDGQQVVTAAAAQTLADNNPHFTQFGLLRGAFEFEDVPVIVVDHALEGDSLRDVEFDALPGSSESTSSDGGADSTDDTAPASTSNADGSGSETSAAPLPATSTTPTDDDGNDDAPPPTTMTDPSTTSGPDPGSSNDAGCSCGTIFSTSPTLFLCALLARRRKRCADLPS